MHTCKCHYIESISLLSPKGQLLIWLDTNDHEKKVIIINDRRANITMQSTYY